MRVLAALLVLAACGGQHSAGPPASATVSPADAGTPPPADAGTPPAPPPASQALEAPPAGRLYHGVLAAGSGATDSATDASEAALDAYEQAVGRKVAYVYFSHEWMVSRAFPSHTVAWIRARGAVPFIRLMLRSQKEPLHVDPVFTLDRIIAGEFDRDLAVWADAARDSGGPLAVEYGTEVNGDWNPWSAPYNGGLDVGPGKFKQAYRHIVTLMRAHAPNITWALHYAGQNFPEDTRNVPAAYYPGDDVVDWVGLSTYGSERSNDHRCNSLRSLVDDMIPQLKAATQTKPFFIFEFGNTSTNPACPSGPWVQAALADLLGGRWPEIRGFAWWEQKWIDGGAVTGSTDMMVEDDAATQAAFRSALASPAVLDAPLLE